MKEQKKEIRRESQRNLERMDLQREDPDKVADYFFESIQPKPGQKIAAYWAKGREFDTSPLLERLLEAGYQCALPIVQKDSRELKFACWVESVALRKGRFDILEPESSNFVDPDIIIVPMLAFDQRGYRLGRGGGYYDATLAALRSQRDILAVGVAYAQQACLFNLPVEEHDQKLDWLITPHGAQDFRK